MRDSAAEAPNGSCSETGREASQRMIASAAHLTGAFILYRGCH